MGAISKSTVCLLLALGLFVSGCKEPTREEKEFKSVEKSASEGSIVAQLRLGWCHEKGFGTKEDIEMAIRCYQRGLEMIELEKGKLPKTLQGWKELPATGEFAQKVQYLIGRYHDNEPTRSDMEFLHRDKRNWRDIDEAVKWYEKAAVGGLAPYASLRLSELHQDESKRLTYLKEAAMQGSGEAKLRLARFYLHGETKLPEGNPIFSGLPTGPPTQDIQKFSEGILLLKEAAELGNRNAILHLRCLYDGTEKSYFEVMDADKARSYERKGDELAILQHDYDVQLWFDPEGMRLDLAWMVPSVMEGLDNVYRERIGALKGDAKAQYVLSVYHAYGRGTKKDQQEAVKWCKQSADSGYPPALLGMGNRFHEGNGVIKDEIEAYAYWNLAGVEIGTARDYVKTLESKLPESARLRAQQRSAELQKEIQSSKLKAGSR